MNVNRIIASCGEEVKIHEWPSGKTVHTTTLSSGLNFKNISWSMSGKQLLAIPSGGKPMLIRQEGEVNEVQYTGNTLEEREVVDAGIFSNNFEELVTFGTSSGEISVVNVFTNTIEKTFTTLPSPVTLLDYTPNDTFLAAGCKNGQIFLYNKHGNICSSFCVPWSNSLSTMMLHPTREAYLVAASKQGVVAIWDVHTNTAKFLAKNHTQKITDMAISASAELLTTVSLDKNVYIYDLRCKDIVFNKIFSSELSAVACALSNEEFAIGTTRGRIFFLDKRQPDFIKGSISSQKSEIRALCFGHSLLDEKSSKLKRSLSDPILVDDESTATQITNVESDLKSQASGDFTLPDDRSGISRIPGGMDDGLKCTEQWIEQLNSDVEKTVPFLQVIEESNLHAMKQELINMSKEIVQKFTEEINSQFLKIRMGVSREFCRMEQNNNKRWQDFNSTLLKLAGYEEARKESDENVQSESMSNDTAFSPAKTKMTTYSNQKFNTK